MIVIATCEGFWDRTKGMPIAPDDWRLLEALRGSGVEADARVWSQPWSWEKADLVIPSSIWDYFLHYDAFLRWIARLDGKLIHPALLLRWNTDKSAYLRDLAAQGVPTIPTYWLRRRVTPVARDYSDLLRMLGGQWRVEHLLIKPAVGSNCHGHCAVLLADERSCATAAAYLRDYPVDRHLLIQPRLDAPLEINHVIFEGRWSHAWLRDSSAVFTPDIARASGTFFGRILDRREIDPAEIALTEEIVRTAEEILGIRIAYARVDLIRGTRDRDRVFLLELECTEPNLRLDVRSALDRFHRLLLSRLAARERGVHPAALARLESVAAQVMPHS